MRPPENPYDSHDRSDRCGPQNFASFPRLRRPLEGPTTLRGWPLTSQNAGGGERNRTAVEGFAGPCLDHSATPPGLYRVPYFTTSRQPVAVTSALIDMRGTFDALGTLQRVAIVSAIVLGTASGLMTAAGAPDVAVFIVSALAIAAFAAVVGQCVDQIGEYMGPGRPVCCSRVWATSPSFSSRSSH